MSLLTRLTIPLDGEVKLPVHQFMASLAEYKRGAPGANLTNISIMFGLSAGEQASLQQFLSNLDSNSISRELIHDVLMLGEIGAYNLNQVKNRLGIT